jgi:hypothetical protein
MVQPVLRAVIQRIRQACGRGVLKATSARSCVRRASDVIPGLVEDDRLSSNVDQSCRTMLSRELLILYLHEGDGDYRTGCLEHDGKFPPPRFAPRDALIQPRRSGFMTVAAAGSIDGMTWRGVR